MREILFQGKRIDNGEWVMGYIWRGASFVCITPHNLGVDHNLAINRIIAIGYEVDPETVGQYTGMDDKNGKKIFEGDIVQDGDLDIRLMNDKRDGKRTGRGVVKYGIHEVPSDDPFCWGTALGFWIDGETLLPTPAQYHQCDIEVIGNIHDNPELMEG